MNTDDIFNEIVNHMTYVQENVPNDFLVIKEKTMELMIGHLLPFSMDQFMALNPDIIDGFESEGITLKPSELCCADKLIYLIKENTPLRFKCTLQ